MLATVWHSLASWNWTAIGTILLALFTGYLGKQTKTTASATRKTAEASDKTADATLKEVEASQKPVVIATRLTYPRREASVAYLEVKNIGVGPAIDVRAIINDPIAKRNRRRVIGSVGRDDTHEVELDYAMVADAQVSAPLRVVLFYNDVAGKRWNSSQTAERMISARFPEARFKDTRLSDGLHLDPPLSPPPYRTGGDDPPGVDAQRRT